MLEKEFFVKKKHSAATVGSGELDVLSTPALIAFMENVAKELAQNDLKDNQTTVGIEVNIHHLKATAIGQTVRVIATLVKQTNAVLFCDVEAFEGDNLIGQGQHNRAIVDVDKFMKDL